MLPDAIDNAPSVKVPSIVSPLAVKVWFPISTLFATVRLVKASAVPPFISGLVSVLFVKVCEPVKVATVESIATVNVFDDPDVSMPVPPAISNVSESRSMLNAPPESP